MRPAVSTRTQSVPCDFAYRTASRATAAGSDP